MSLSLSDVDLSKGIAPKIDQTRIIRDPSGRVVGVWQGATEPKKAGSK